ncbi:MAG: cupin domain-containing protein [candidate division Zixibacteria bacterium]|nr:cupin domain-containing protein [candidate division Zixibacteria bacterium]
MAKKLNDLSELFVNSLTKSCNYIFDFKVFESVSATAKLRSMWEILRDKDIKKNIELLKEDIEEIINNPKKEKSSTLNYFINKNRACIPISKNYPGEKALCLFWFYTIDNNEAENASNYYCYPGKEFIYIKEGRVDFCTIGDNIRLSKGETLYYNSLIPHKFSDTTNDFEAIVLIDSDSTIANINESIFNSRIINKESKTIERLWGHELAEAAMVSEENSTYYKFEILFEEFKREYNDIIAEIIKKFDNDEIDLDWDEIIGKQLSNKKDSFNGDRDKIIERFYEQYDLSNLQPVIMPSVLNYYADKQRKKFPLDDFKFDSLFKYINTNVNIDNLLEEINEDDKIEPKVSSTEWNEIVTKALNDTPIKQMDYRLSAIFHKSMEYIREKHPYDLIVDQKSLNIFIEKYLWLQNQYLNRMFITLRKNKGFTYRNLQTYIGKSLGTWSSMEANSIMLPFIKNVEDVYKYFYHFLKIPPREFIPLPLIDKEYCEHWKEKDITKKNISNALRIPHDSKHAAYINLHSRISSTNAQIYYVILTPADDESCNPISHHDQDEIDIIIKGEITCHSERRDKKDKKHGGTILYAGDVIMIPHNEPHEWKVSEGEAHIITIILPYSQIHHMYNLQKDMEFRLLSKADEIINEELTIADLNTDLTRNHVLAIKKGAFDKFVKKSVSNEIVEEIPKGFYVTYNDIKEYYLIKLKDLKNLENNTGFLKEEKNYKLFEKGNFHYIKIEPSDKSSNQDKDIDVNFFSKFKTDKDFIVVRNHNIKILKELSHQ